MNVTSDKPAPRWSVLAPVMPRATKHRPDWHATNISETGMFVSGELLLDAGSEVEVDIVLPGAYGPPLEITSLVEVVWARDPADASANRPAGMGMRFLGIDQPMREELRAYLAELASYQSKSRSSIAEIPTTYVDVQSISVVAPAKPTPPLVTSATPPPPPVETNSEVKKGDKLGRYTILDRIATGGMGDVFLAQHTSLGRRVALKLLQHQHLHDMSAVRRFYDEARVVNQISHDNIVQITDLVVGEEHTFIVMELLVGQTLNDQIRRGGMPLSRIAGIVRQLCSALGAVHRAGIVHRDLKPSNVMLVSRHGNPDFVKLLDFGIAKLREESFEGPRTLAGQAVGTPGYMSPEQLLGEAVDARSDIYSLGVVLFAMVTGQMPFVAASWTEMMLCQLRDTPRTASTALGKAVPRAVETMIARCLERDPRNRPGTAAEVAAAITAGAVR